MKKFLQIFISIFFIFFSSTFFLPAKAGAGTTVSGYVTVTTCSSDGSLATVWDISGTFYNVSAGDYLIMTLYTPGKSYQYAFLGGQPASSNLTSVSFKVKQNSPTSVYTGGGFSTGPAAGNQISNTNRTLEFYDSLSGTHKIGSYQIQFQCDVPAATTIPTPTASQAPVTTKTPVPTTTRVPAATSTATPNPTVESTAAPTDTPSVTTTEEPTSTDTPTTETTIADISGSTSFSTPSWLGYVCCFFFLLLIVAVALLAFYLNRRKKDKPVFEKPAEVEEKKDGPTQK